VTENIFAKRINTGNPTSEIKMKRRSLASGLQSCGFPVSGDSVSYTNLQYDIKKV